MKKSNEVPEKIYLDEDESWHLTNPNGDSIEYVKTDAFIKKACEFLKSNVNDYTDNGCGDTSFVLIQDLIEDFRNYMKGE